MFMSTSSSLNLNLTYTTLNLPFEYPFTISGGRTKTHQPSLLVRLSFAAFTGYGEAPAIAYYNLPLDKMILDLEQHKNEILSFPLTSSSDSPIPSPFTFWSHVSALFPCNSFLLAALDLAYWDLYGQIMQKPLFVLFASYYSKDFLSAFYPSRVSSLLLGHWPVDCVPCDYTIGIASLAEMNHKMQTKPWPIYKIKVGLSDDLDRLASLRSLTNSPFRVDANAGWSLNEAINKIPLMKDLGVEFVEQPLEKSAWEDQKQLYSISQLPLIADESCVSESDVTRCVGYYHGINIKLTKCGGISPALRMIKQAREVGLSIMMGCMNECSVGSAAIANFIPFLDYVDMDGPLLLKEDVAEGIVYEHGKISLSGRPGLGILVKQPWR
jgi:L-alanine-DL-glutamate epimerase-like enolase superfamily enzyme